MRKLATLLMVCFMVSCSDSSEQNMELSKKDLQHQQNETTEQTGDVNDEKAKQEADEVTKQQENVEQNPVDEKAQDTSALNTELSVTKGLYGYVFGPKCLKTGQTINTIHISIPKEGQILTCEPFSENYEEIVGIFISLSHVKNGTYELVPGASNKNVFGCQNCLEDSLMKASVRYIKTRKLNDVLEKKLYDVLDGTVTISDLKYTDQDNWIKQDFINIQIKGTVDIEGDVLKIDQSFTAEPCFGLRTDTSMGNCE